MYNTYAFETDVVEAREGLNLCPTYELMIIY